MTTNEAAAKSGFSAFTIKQACNHGEMLATKPRGDRGGWDISEAALQLWIATKRRAGANAPMREAMKKGVAA